MAFKKAKQRLVMVTLTVCAIKNKKVITAKKKKKKKTQSRLWANSSEWGKQTSVGILSVHLFISRNK